MKTIPPLRVHSQKLSLWQSTVVGYIINHQLSGIEKNDRMTTAAVQSHPMVIAVNRHVEKAIQKDYDNTFLQMYSLTELPESDQILEMLSEITFQIAIARIKQADEYERDLMEAYRKYSDHDPGFINCAAVYAEYYYKYNGKLKYNSWRTQGNGDMNYGKIAYKLSNDAKVAIIGDWGTGMQDAEYLLSVIINQHKPDAIIHLGDIYYSGTPEECLQNFKKIIDKVFDSTLGKGKRLPVFSIPGNHDYYAFAYYYYEMVTGLNETIPEALQLASYFCLETEDTGWQFLGMDTGFQDARPVDQLNPFATGPSIQRDEYIWHKDKLENSDAATILLSHHQLFSHNGKINGMDSVYSAYPNINKYLLDLFQPHFNNKVAAWLWGHEHNQVIFNDNNFGLPKGRLIGASAYEEAVSADPYKINYPNAPFNEQVKLGSANDYLNHSYAIIDFSNRSSPKDAIDISYYQYPSWDDTCIPNPIPSNATFMYQEKLHITPSNIGNQIQYGELISINLENGLDFIGPLDFSLNEYFPTIGMQAVNLMIMGSTGAIRDGDTVQIATTEPKAGKYNVLGAWKTSRTLYYYKPGYDGQNWIIKKVNTATGDDFIHENEAVYFVNTNFKGQFLCPFLSVAYSGMYTSTDANVPSKWFLNKAK